MNNWKLKKHNTLSLTHAHTPTDTSSTHAHTHNYVHKHTDWLAAYFDFSSNLVYYFQYLTKMLLYRGKRGTLPSRASIGCCEAVFLHSFIVRGALIEMPRTKRTRNLTTSPDKPADKSVKLDICVTCYNSISGECIMCCWCAQWEHRICANIKQSEFVMLESPSKNIHFFCSSCVTNLPKALDLFTSQSQLDEKFEAKF